MTDKNKFLLPTGFRDLLSDDAEKEYFCTHSVIESFYSKGYRLVSTPLVEFEDSLFDGAGEALEPRTLKFIDPASQKTVGLRADITTQISRLVKSRLQESSLPLKLCYSGDIVRSYPQNTRGQRQLRQAGLELIDKKLDAKADAEVAIIALEAISKLGLRDLSIDLHTPELINNQGIELTPEVRKSLEKRDIANLSDKLAKLVKASGNAEKAFAADIKDAQVEHTKKVYEAIKAAKLPVNVTVDFIENRGFEYHKTFSFSLFCKEIRDEIGRGGRYGIGNLEATGFTIYISALLEKIAKAKIKF